MTIQDPTEQRQRIPTLRVPGAVYLRLNEYATRLLDDGAGWDLDIADAVSRATVKRKGRGHQAFIPLEPNQIDRIAMWLKEGERMDFYNAADALRAQLEAEAGS